MIFFFLNQQLGVCNMLLVLSHHKVPVKWHPVMHAVLLPHARGTLVILRDSYYRITE